MLEVISGTTELGEILPQGAQHLREKRGTCESPEDHLHISKEYIVECLEEKAE